MCSLARESATTRVSKADPGSRSAGLFGSKTMTLSGLDDAADSRISNAARHAPTGPPPTTSTSTVSVMGLHLYVAVPVRVRVAGSAQQTRHSLVPGHPWRAASGQRAEDRS